MTFFGPKFGERYSEDQNFRWSIFFLSHLGCFHLHKVRRFNHFFIRGFCQPETSTGAHVGVWVWVWVWGGGKKKVKEKISYARQEPGAGIKSSLWSGTTTTTTLSVCVCVCVCADMIIQQHSTILNYVWRSQTLVKGYFSCLFKKITCKSCFFEKKKKRMKTVFILITCI